MDLMNTIWYLKTHLGDFFLLFLLEEERVEAGMKRFHIYFY